MKKINNMLLAIALVAAFTLGVLAFLSIAALLIPRARIQLTPRVQVQDSTIQVQAQSEQEQESAAEQHEVVSRRVQRAFGEGRN